jgi:NAD(P)-dependent dehydrogenase (short-subunit alcohol dehydrogenase family)
MRILIAGATGAIGRPSVRRLRANQHEVFALARSPDSAPALKQIGAEAVIADALDAAAVKAAVRRIRPDAVINELTSLPRHYTPGESHMIGKVKLHVGPSNRIAKPLSLAMSMSIGEAEFPKRDSVRDAAP